ncbi:MAG: hypothetical protein IJ173_00850 [Kiritimatiellae bacterium]|nr:hypothetical protein [Kiritimatiellia bacterium]
MKTKRPPILRLAAEICPACHRLTTWRVRKVRARQNCRVQYLACAKCGAHATRILA